MTINEASDFFNDLIGGTNKRSELKIYKEFLGILSSLKEKDLTEKNVESIEIKLSGLNLKANPIKRKKYLNLKFQEFTSYLRDEYSLLTDGYYTTIGIAIGPGFGLIFGLVVLSFIERSLGLTYGMMAGMLLGYLVGLKYDTKAEKENRVLKQKK